MRVYVRPYRGPGGATLVSLQGGSQPAWAQNGRELFFRAGNRMMAVEVGAAETFEPGIPRLLFEHAGGFGGSRNYDVTRDGQRFVMVMGQGTNAGSSGTELRVVLNWFEELKRLVPSPENR